MPALSAGHVQGHQKGSSIARRQDPVPLVSDAISPELPSLYLRTALFLIECWMSRSFWRSAMALRPGDEFTRIGNLVHVGGQLVKPKFQR